jgi:hypothetical protein
MATKEASCRRRMYSGCVGVRCAERLERSELKLEDVLGTVPEGTKDSFSIFMRRPRREVSVWRDLNASMSSFDAAHLWLEGAVQPDYFFGIPEIPDCMMN